MENLSSSSGSITSSPSLSNTGSSSMLDQDKIQKIIANYQKLKSQNALLKKAIIQEQQKNAELDKEVKSKEQALVTSMQEHDILEFNNQRLTKRIQTMQEEMNSSSSRKEGGSWFFNNSKIELQKKEDEINLLRMELQERIDDNANLHTVTNDKETAFKQMEASLRMELIEKDKSLTEKDSKINHLVELQKQNEQNLINQTQSLRNNIESLQNDLKKSLSTIKLRDDVVEQLNDLLKHVIDNSPSITINYPLENITPSNERISIESIVFDKDFSVDSDSKTIDQLSNQSTWKPIIRQTIQLIQSIFSNNLQQISSIISSHNDSVRKLEQSHQQDKQSLSESINQLSLLKEENQFTLNGLKEEITEKDQTILTLTRSIGEQKDILEQLSDSNKDYEVQIEKDTEKFKLMKEKLEKELEECRINSKNEIKQLSDQHQGLLKHQKQLLNNKIDEQKNIISQYEKKITNLEQKLKEQQQQENKSNLVNIDDDFSLSTISSNNNNSNETPTNNNLIDLSFLDTNTSTTTNGETTQKEQEEEEKSSSSPSSSPKIEDTSVPDNISIPTITSTNITTTTTNTTSNDNSSTISSAISGRFKLTVLDETGELSDSLNLTFEDKEREKEMRNYYESKITQLLNKISNIDAKAMRYYDQYNQLIKKGQNDEAMQKEIEKARQEAKDTKEELEITRTNYDQQMKLLTEQYISLNESITNLDSDLIKIKQHKVVCAKCKAWNPLDHIFSPDNYNLICLKGNHPIQTIVP